MTDVFISYSSHDSEYALQTRRVLEEKGITSFLVEYGIPVGESWSHAIRRAMEESKQVIVLVSRNSMESNWVQFELGAAWGMGKRVIPLLLPGTKATDLPPLLSGFQAFEFENIKHLSNELSEALRG